MKHNCSYTSLVEVSKLLPNPKNPNEHPKEQIERLAKVIEYQGQRSPIVVSNRSGFITKGHGRLEAMKYLKWKKVAVDYQDYKDEAQEYADIVADNALSSWSELNLANVNSEMLDFGPDFDIDMLGIKDFVLELADVLDPQADEDDVPDVEQPITRRGDIWLLGSHRLMCGDSTMIDDVEKLVNGHIIDLVHTDPPYGINESGDRSNRNGKNSLITGVKYENFDDSSTDAALMAYSLCEGLGIPRQVWWGANYYCHALPQTNNWMVWDKRIDEKQKDDNSDCELAWVKSKWSSIRIFRHLWKGLIKGSERGQARVHPTQKPVALAEWVFEYYKSEFNNVMDLFGGSGSTLIACENKQKNCFMMECTEHYCDVIIKRWEEYTGKKATLELTNQTYEELKAERDGQT